MASTVVIILWACSVPSTAIIVFRLIYRRFKKVFDLGDWFALLSLVLILARHGLQLSAFYLKTGFVTPEMHSSLTPDDIEARVRGSKVQFAGRAVFTAFIWSEKCVLFAFYQQLIHRLRWQRHINIAYWTTFAATFVAVELATFLDCRPFRLYFEIVSDPNSCIRAYSQIISYGVCNIITDIMLIVLPLRILSLINRPRRQKIQLALLFSIGIFIIILTIVRLQQVFTGGGSHVIRTVWGSAEVLASAIVANLPPIVGAYHLERKPKGAVSGLTGVTKTAELHLSSLKAEGEIRTSITSGIDSEPTRSSGSDNFVRDEYLTKQKIRVTDVEHG